MKFRYSIFALFILAIIIMPFFADAESVRKERTMINKGNSQYRESKFKEAQNSYEEALKVNSSSAEARYNLALSQIRQVKNPADTSSQNAVLVNAARKNFTDVASIAATKPGIAAKANYNLGNIEFNVKDYAKAIEYYKQALRIDPKDDNARKNLRIAQKNLQKQNQDKNNQDQNQDKDQQQNQDQDKKQDNQDQQQNQKQDKDRETKQDNNLSNQAASRILQAIDNKEAATRARVNKANKGEKSSAPGANMRRW